MISSPRSNLYGVARLNWSACWGCCRVAGAGDTLQVVCLPPDEEEDDEQSAEEEEEDEAATAIAALNKSELALLAYFVLGRRAGPALSHDAPSICRASGCSGILAGWEPVSLCGVEERVCSTAPCLYA